MFKYQFTLRYGQGHTRLRFLYIFGQITPKNELQWPPWAATRTWILLIWFLNFLKTYLLGLFKLQLESSCWETWYKTVVFIYFWQNQPRNLHTMTPCWLPYESKLLKCIASFSCTTFVISRSSLVVTLDGCTNHIWTQSYDYEDFMFQYNSCD